MYTYVYTRTHTRTHTHTHTHTYPPLARRSHPLTNPRLSSNVAYAEVILAALMQELDISCHAPCIRRPPELLTVTSRDKLHVPRLLLRIEARDISSVAGLLEFIVVETLAVIGQIRVPDDHVCVCVCVCVCACVRARASVCVCVCVRYINSANSLYRDF